MQDEYSNHGVRFSIDDEGNVYLVYLRAKQEQSRKYENRDGTDSVEYSSTDYIIEKIININTHEEFESKKLSGIRNTEVLYRIGYCTELIYYFRNIEDLYKAGWLKKQIDGKVVFSPVNMAVHYIHIAGVFFKEYRERKKQFDEKIKRIRETQKQIRETEKRIRETQKRLLEERRAAKNRETVPEKTV